MREPLSAQHARPLLDGQDLAWFEENEAGLAQSLENFSGTDEFLSLFMHFGLWRQQAAWLTIEQAFNTSPSLMAVEVTRDSNDGEGVYVHVLRKDETHWFELGTDPERVDERLQEYLNNMSRTDSAVRRFHSLISTAAIFRAELDTVAASVLGEEWTAKRRLFQLNAALPDVSVRAPKLPRL